MIVPLLALSLQADSAEVGQLMDRIVTTHDVTSQLVGDRFIGDDYVEGRGFFARLSRSDGSLPDAGKIVRLGAKAVPELLARLESTRPTSETIGPSPWAGFFIEPIRDPKIRGDKEPWTLPAADFGPEVKGARLTEGDLAYALLGQIVNRWYVPVRGSGMLFLSLPSLSSDLGWTVRRDWKGLDESGLKESLTEDVLHPDSAARAVLGFRRFATFYPRLAEPLAIGRLKQLVRNAPRYPHEGPRTMDWIQAIGSVESPEVDRWCARLLAVYDVQKPRRRTEREVPSLVARLWDRPAYRARVVTFARHRIAQKEDAYGHYAELIRYQQ